MPEVNPLLVVTVMSLEDLDSGVLAAANLGITLYGYLIPENVAYKPLLDAALIKENGYPADKETLLDALSHVINKRVEAGTFK